MAVKFPLKMADGATVRTIKELQDHFDLATVLSYYKNDRLVKWLENGYYDEEARKVADLNSASPDFVEKICEILGVSCSVSERAQVDLDDISERNKRLERLKQYTVDDTILAAVDRVAFTQEDLDNLLLKYGFSTEFGTPYQFYITTCIPEPDTFLYNMIYLCGDYFTIPPDVCCITYIGVNRPKIGFTPVTSEERLWRSFWWPGAIRVLNTEFDIDNLKNIAVRFCDRLSVPMDHITENDATKLMIKMLEEGDVLSWVTRALEAGKVESWMILTVIELLEEGDIKDWMMWVLAEGELKVWMLWMLTKMMETDIDDECKWMITAEMLELEGDETGDEILDRMMGMLIKILEKVNIKNWMIGILKEGEVDDEMIEMFKEMLTEREV